MLYIGMCSYLRRYTVTLRSSCSLFLLFQYTDNGDCDCAPSKQEINVLKNYTMNAFEYLLQELPSLKTMVASITEMKNEDANIIAKLDAQAREQAEIKAKLNTIARKQAGIIATLGTIAKKQDTINATVHSITRKQDNVKAKVGTIARKQGKIDAAVRPTARKQDHIKAKVNTIARKQAKIDDKLDIHIREQAKIKAELDALADFHMNPDRVTECNRIFDSCSHVSKDCPSGYYWITNSNGTIVQLYCDMDRHCACSDVTGGWTRVAYLDMTNSTHHCPSAWRQTTHPKRTCRHTIPFDVGGCSSATFSTHGISYSRVCGRIVGYQYGQTCGFEGFWSDSPYDSIDDPYIDGVSVTHGTTPRKLICCRPSGGRQ